MVMRPSTLSGCVASLRRDGYVTDPETGHITSAGPQFAAGLLAGLKDASAIREQLDRIQRAIDDDPALAVGSAKELIESTAKVVLAERGLPVNDRADLPELVRQAQQALGLHPASAAPGPDSTEAVRRILGGVATIAAGLAELRNRGYGTGHGADRRGAASMMVSAVSLRDQTSIGEGFLQ
jgi:Abortive infection C-terminus